MGEIKVKYIGAVVAMALVFSIYVGVNAKETKVEQNVPAQQEFLDWEHNGSDPQNAAEYALASPSTECNGNQLICQIKAPADLVNDPSGNTPDLTAFVNSTERVSDQIQDALDNDTPNETASMKNTQ